LSQIGSHYETQQGGNIFVKEFEDNNLEEFSIDFLDAESDPMVTEIFIWISSYGGNIHNALAMIDLTQAASKPVFMIGYGKAMSAGCLLLASGKKGQRFVTPNTYTMIHEASGGAHGKTQDVLQQAKELTDLNERMLKLLSKFTGKAVSFFKKYIKDIHNTDLSLDAKQTVGLGLADYVGIPKRISQPAPQKMIAIYSDENIAKKSAK
jgi:ATP-dependent Clp protease protease subunit